MFTTNLPSDIQNQIVADFPKHHQLTMIHLMELKEIQLARSIVFLAQGDLHKVVDELLPMSYIDPRDVIFDAENQSGNNGHWMCIPLEDVYAFLRSSPHESPPDLPDAFYLLP